MKQPKFLVLCGDGINCERETARAFVLAGGAAEICHVNDLVAAPEKLRGFDGLALPGGFAFGDELGSGQILALKIKYKLGEAFSDFVAAGRPVIGICNGFQTLVKLGLLPGGEKAAALAANEQGGFIDRWVNLEVEQKSVCRWTSGLASLELPIRHIELPIRHGEGRMVFTAESVYTRLCEKGQVALRYSEDVNGSHGRIAGICDEAGLVFGLMPHPEAFVSGLTHPSRMERGAGLKIFENIVNYMSGKEEKAHVAG